jgi:hypothetical protein
MAEIMPFMLCGPLLRRVDRARRQLRAQYGVTVSRTGLLHAALDDLVMRMAVDEHLRKEVLSHDLLPKDIRSLFHRSARRAL